MKRRDVLGLGGAWALGGCQPAATSFAGGWVGASAERGHRLRERKSGTLGPPAVERRCGVAIVGGGIAGLACARGLRRAGVDDVQLFELEDSPGGNSRGHRLAGQACPLGAHYLPLPGPNDAALAELLDELGLRRLVHGQPVYDELALCHSPQERLWIDGTWVDGLLPPTASRNALERFSDAVSRAQRELGFAMPTAHAGWSTAHAALDAVTFAAWLDAQGHSDLALRWYLDYSCLDDYGADSHGVSAWAGLHYFASRHGFHADDSAAADRVLTWPEGNAWLASHLAAPLGGRAHTGCIVLRVEARRDAVTLDLWREAPGQLERWQARQVVLALPLHVAARVVESPPAALVEAAAMLPHAPWLVANLALDAALAGQPGVPLAWDNVAYGRPGLGYVNAGHQSLRPDVGANVLTAYWALGSGGLAGQRRQRERLLSEPASVWAAEVVAELARLHPDLPGKLRQVDLMRYGHAMAVPAPGVRGHPALRALSAAGFGRLHFAHADLSGYSVFEEAFFHGCAVARRLAPRV